MCVGFQLEPSSLALGCARRNCALLCFVVIAAELHHQQHEQMANFGGKPRGCHWTGVTFNSHTHTHTHWLSVSYSVAARDVQGGF